MSETDFCIHLTELCEGHCHWGFPFLSGSRQSASWISKLEVHYVTFLVLLTNIRMNRAGKFLF